MRAGRYLRRRNNTWFFRYRFASRLAACGLSGELIRTLRTSDRRVAAFRARMLALRMEATMSQTELPSKAELEGMVRGWIDGMLWNQEIWRAATGGLQVLAPDEIDRRGKDDARELDCLLRFCRGIHEKEQKQAINDALDGRGDIAAFQPIVQAAAQQMNITVDPATLNGRVVERTIVRGLATFLDEARDVFAAIPRQIAAVQSKPSLPTFPFLQYWTEFKLQKIARHDWKDDTGANGDSSRNVFERLFPGATVANVYSTSIAGDFKTRLFTLPKHYSRGDWAEMTVDEMVAAAADKTVPKVKSATVNKHTGNMGEYCDFLVEKKYLPEGLKNPFSGLHTARPKGKGARNERFNWTEALEKKLFSAPWIMGCKSLARRNTPGTNIFRDALFWVILWGRLTGVRESEICDAKVGQIKTKEGIPHLEIVDGKDSGSERLVPVPQLLLDMGFMEHRVIGRDPTAPLFPELIEQGPGKRRSAAFSGKFTYLREKNGCYAPKIDFHSFRGNVETQLKNTTGISSAWIDELIGHESPIRRSEGARYTKEIYLPILRRCVDTITMNADLTHLEYHGVRGKPAPGRDREIATYVAIADKEMAKKALRKRVRQD